MGDDARYHQWPTPDWWKELARAAFAEGPRGLKADAARALGITGSAITQMIGPAAKQSRHALALSEFLRIPRPSGPAEAALAEWERIGHELTAEEREAVLQFIRTLKR